MNMRKQIEKKAADMGVKLFHVNIKKSMGSCQCGDLHGDLYFKVIDNDNTIVYVLRINQPLRWLTPRANGDLDIAYYSSVSYLCWEILEEAKGEGARPIENFRANINFKRVDDVDDLFI